MAVELAQGRIQAINSLARLAAGLLHRTKMLTAERVRTILYNERFVETTKRGGSVAAGRGKAQQENRVQVVEFGALHTLQFDPGSSANIRPKKWQPTALLSSRLSHDLLQTRGSPARHHPAKSPVRAHRTNLVEGHRSAESLNEKARKTWLSVVWVAESTHDSKWPSCFALRGRADKPGD